MRVRRVRFPCRASAIALSELPPIAEVWGSRRLKALTHALESACYRTERDPAPKARLWLGALPHGHARGSASALNGSARSTPGPCGARKRMDPLRQRVEPQVFSNPGVHQAGRRESAKQSQAARESTCRISEFRARRASRFQH